MNREQKQQRIENYETAVQEATFAILTEHGKMSVQDVEELRNQLLELGCGTMMLKNTLARIVFERNELEEICEYLTGPSMLFYGNEEIAPVAKALAKVGKKHKELKVKAVLFDGGIYPAGEFRTFTTMPTKDEVRSKLLSVFMAPATSFVRVIGPAGRLATVLKQYADKQGE